MQSKNDIASILAKDEIDYIENLCASAKKASAALRTIKTEQKNQALLILAEMLDTKRNDIIIENGQDVENATINGLSAAMIDRLVIDNKVIDGMITSLNEIAKFKDPVGEVSEGWVLPNGIKLEKLRVPIGVISIIYESRPDVTIEVGALALKSSNAAILRGGKEAILSNKTLAILFQKSLQQAGLPAEAIQLVEHTNRNLMLALLQQSKTIDLVVPRGGAGLINFVSENSAIPVVKHDKGVCHIYVHASADKEKSIPVILNSKTQRPGVCNAAECIIIDKEVKYKEEILQALLDAGVTLHADAMTKDALPDFAMESLLDDGYGTEYLSMDVSIKLANNFDHAISHIQNYSSAHTDAILAENHSVIEDFLNTLDSAALCVNASTRFHDGGQFGLGAEVGISTGKLHCRGPMGLKDLTTSKYLVQGNGQIRS